MSITVTWAEEGKDPEQFVLAEDLLRALEQYRLSQTRPQPTANGQWATAPRDASIRDMVVRIFQECLVNHAISMFPPPEMEALQAQARAAQQAVEEAKAAALLSVVVPVGPVDGGKEEK